MKVKYLILGAGPAGLTFANCLYNKGITDFVVLEKESEAGGLCRSAMVDGSPFDIGGGHFLDVRRQNVNDFLFSFMPENEWNLFERDSRIFSNNMYVGHPFEANIWQFPEALQNEYLESIAAAGCNQNEPMPEKFIDWIYWKLGKKIADDYMIPYNSKMFSDELNELGTYWLNKLPSVSYEDTLASCRDHQAHAKQPGHAQFYYPKQYGYGELWLRMAEKIADNIIYDAPVNELDMDTKTVRYGANNESISADKIITTIPWKSIASVIGLTSEATESINALKHSSIETRYCPTNMDTEAQWIYYPDASLPYHRILVRSNFATGSKGYWYETRIERTHMFDENDDSYRYVNEYAYPLNTIDKPEIMKDIIAQARAKNVYPLGRWGEHMHYNSDVTVDLAMKLCDELA